MTYPWKILIMVTFDTSGSLLHLLSAVAAAMGVVASAAVAALPLAIDDLERPLEHPRQRHVRSHSKRQSRPSVSPARPLATRTTSSSSAPQDAATATAAPNGVAATAAVARHHHSRQSNATSTSTEG